MTAWAAYPARYAARTPHPYILILRNSGQLFEFCPKSGHVCANCAVGKREWFQVHARISGRVGRVGQKNPGYTRARNLGGLGGDILVCRRRISALSAPRAPPSCFLSCFQWVAGSVFCVGFCPVLSRSAPSAPNTIIRNQHFDFHSIEATKSGNRGW